MIKFKIFKIELKLLKFTRLKSKFKIKLLRFINLNLKRKKLKSKLPRLKLNY